MSERFAHIINGTDFETDRKRQYDPTMWAVSAEDKPILRYLLIQSGYLKPSADVPESEST